MQVATLVVPFTVLLAWAMGQPLDLNFNAFESLILFASVIIVVVSLMVSGAHAHMHTCMSLTSTCIILWQAAFVYD